VYWGELLTKPLCECLTIRVWPSGYSCAPLLVFRDAVLTLDLLFVHCRNKVISFQLAVFGVPRFQCCQQSKVFHDVSYSVGIELIRSSTTRFRPRLVLSRPWEVQITSYSHKIVFRALWFLCSVSSYLCWFCSLISHSQEADVFLFTFSVGFGFLPFFERLVGQCSAFIEGGATQIFTIRERLRRENAC
jgi:hypothetical protein